MRKQRLHAISILSLFLLFVLVSCGESAPTSNTTRSRTSTSETVLIQMNNSLSARSATDGSQLWSFSQSGYTLSHLVISANHLYWNSTSSTIDAVDLGNGKRIWSTPITGNITDLQATTSLVYVLSDGVLSAFDVTNGTLKWHMDKIGLAFLDRNAGGNFFVNGNTIYTLVSGIVSALDATTGSQLWQFTSPSSLNTETTAPTVKELALSPDGKTLLVKYNTAGDHALYALNTSSHQQAWHLDPTSTEFGLTYHDMSLNWFRITQDNHLLIDATFSGLGQHLTLDHPEEFRYLSLSDGSMVWSLPIMPASGFTSEGNGQTLVLGNEAFYSIGGPSGGDISATSLSNHQQTWNVPSSGSYEKLFLENDVLLAWSGSGKNILTALSTQNGKQLWQVTKALPVPTPTVVSYSSSSQTQSIQNIAIDGQSVFVEQREYITRDGVVNALDLHTGKQQWSMTIPGSSTMRLAVSF